MKPDAADVKEQERGEEVAGPAHARTDQTEIGPEGQGRGGKGGGPGEAR